MASTLADCKYRSVSAEQDTTSVVARPGGRRLTRPTCSAPPSSRKFSKRVTSRKKRSLAVTRPLITESGHGPNRQWDSPGQLRKWKPADSHFYLSTFASLNKGIFYPRRNDRIRQMRQTDNSLLQNILFADTINLVDPRESYRVGQIKAR